MGREGQGGVIITLESFVRKDLDQGRFSGDGDAGGGEAGVKDGGGVSAGGSCESVHGCDVDGPQSS